MHSFLAHSRWRDEAIIRWNEVLPSVCKALPNQSTAYTHKTYLRHKCAVQCSSFCFLLHNQGQAKVCNEKKKKKKIIR